MKRLMAFLLLIPVATGCGTVLNLSSFDVPERGQGIFRPGHHLAPKVVYGGVQTDAVAGKGWFEEAKLDGSRAAVGLYVWLIDLPLSAVADTVTLPITIPAAVARGMRSGHADSEQERERRVSPERGEIR
jgi:uncharacterized protein YceK